MITLLRLKALLKEHKLYRCDMNNEEAIALLLKSRLVRLYKLLYKPMAKVMENGDFRPPTAAKPLDRF